MIIGSQTVRHVTLNSGNSIMQSRADIGDVAIDALQDVIDRLVSGAPSVPVPGRTGYTIEGVHIHHQLIVTLRTATGTPILTTGVGTTADASELWRSMHESAWELATRADRAPPVPWIADRIEPGAVLHIDALVWTGDLSRCVGFAWLDYVGAVQP